LINTRIHPLQHDGQVRVGFTARARSTSLAWNYTVRPLARNRIKPKRWTENCMVLC